MEEQTKNKRRGRPKGSANVRTREIADRAAREGITPLEVMLAAMRHAYDMAAQSGDAEKLELLSVAAEHAKSAAPYIHPRLSSVEVSGPNGGPVSFHAWLQSQRQADPLPPELASPSTP